MSAPDVQIRVESDHRSAILRSGLRVGVIYQEGNQYVFEASASRSLTHDELMKVTRHIRRRNRAIPK